MHDLIAFLRPAVSRLPTAGIMGAYIFSKTHIYTRNYGMLAAVPFPSDIEFNLPADELDAALARMQTVTDLGFQNGRLIIKAGKLKASIDTIDAEPPELQQPAVAAASSFPAGLQQALKTALAFTGDMGPFQGVRLTQGKVAAMCNTHGVILDVPGLEIDGARLLPRELAEFLADAPLPTTFAANADSIECTWPNGAWIIGQLQAGTLGEAPEKALAIVEGQTAGTLIDEAWRAALDDVTALSDGMVMIDATGMHGAKGKGDAEHEFKTGLNGPTHWQASVLAPVFACATAWAPEHWPRTLFTGPRLRGIVIGRKG